MILKSLPLSIVLDVVLICTEKMFKLPRKGCFIKETNKRQSKCIVIKNLESWIFFKSPGK